MLLTPRDSFLHEQLHQPSTDPRVNNRLDLFIGAIRQVGQCPASISQHIWITAEQKSRQHTETRRHLTLTRNKDHKRHRLSLTPELDERHSWKHKSYKRGERTHRGKVWRRVLPPAEVGQCPYCIAGCCETVGLSKQPADKNTACCYHTGFDTFRKAEEGHSLL